IRFTGKKASQSKITIKTNDLDNPTVIVTLKGTVKTPQAAVKPTELSILAPSRFLGHLSYHGVGSFTVTNTGAPGSSLFVSLDVAQGDFSLFSPDRIFFLQKG